MSIEFELNGRRVAITESEDSLLEILRERFDLIAAKDGCSPQGLCGCCTVLVDDRPTLACLTPVSRVAGRSVRTLEGFADEDRDLFAAAFTAAAGLQCGFCIPGIVVRAKHVLDRHPGVDRASLARRLRGHLCRCTGYTKILDAIILADRHRREGLPIEIDASHGVGESAARYEGAQFALGERRYVDDIKLPGMLHGAVVMSPAPRALIRHIDTSKAESREGVAFVLTAQDVPGKRFQGLIVDDWPVFVAEGETTHHAGDILAVVVASSESIARRAAQCVTVDHEVLEAVTSPERALESDAPLVHPGGNLLSRSAMRRGDVEKAFADAAHVVEEEFSTQFIEHAFLEPESAIAYPRDDGRMHVLSQGQGVFDDRRQIASVLGCDSSDVVVELITNGGAFGGKEDLSIQAHAALAARRAGAPVRITLSRDESIRFHPKRHPIKMRYAVAADSKGRILGVRARILGDKGAYASVGAKVLERAAGHSTGPYRVPAADIESLAVYTNNPPCGAMRGFGANQAAFAIEGCLDRLADLCGIDGWEIRWRNALDEGDRFLTGQRLDDSVGLKETLLAVKEDYRRARFAGIACAVKNVGIGNGLPEIGRVAVDVSASGDYEIHCGHTEMGQGLFTVVRQIFCDAMGVASGRVRCTTDTTFEVDSGMTTASRGTVLMGQAVLDAAVRMRAIADAEGESALFGRSFIGEWDAGLTHAFGSEESEPRTHVCYGFATQVVILDDEGRLERVVAAHDVGRVLNPKLLEGQIEGSIHMGLGYALTEELVVRDARIQSTSLADLGILRAQDMPQVEVRFVEAPSSSGPFGAKGVGEIGLVPTAPAVAAALYAFDGIRRRSLPMRDSPAARALTAARRRIKTRAASE